MEYLSAGSLRTLLSQRGRLPVDDAVRIAGTMRRLSAAHARGSCIATSSRRTSC